MSKTEVFLSVGVSRCFVRSKLKSPTNAETNSKPFLIPHLKEKMEPANTNFLIGTKDRSKFESILIIQVPSSYYHLLDYCKNNNKDVEKNLSLYGSFFDFKYVYIVMHIC